jgi:uncharacterized protein (TIGR02145 family)
MSHSLFRAATLIIFLLTLSSPLHADTIPLTDLPIGQVISISGMSFVKVAENQFQALCGNLACGSVTHCAACSLEAGNPCYACEVGYKLVDGECEAVPVCDLGATGTMQTWTGCAALATPAYTEGVKATYFTQGPCLTDERDGKNYEIRKFPDGKCWMVDNLAYGGTTDACSGKTAFAGAGSATASNTFGTGTYGDCRDPRVGASSTGPCYNSNQCGYHYNWQGAMQLASAYNSTSVSYPSGTPSTTNYITGICPTGWHLPSGGTNITASEFQKLHNSVGGGATEDYNNGVPYTAFWKPTSTSTLTSSDPWKGLYSGLANSVGSLSLQGSVGYWWSSTESSAASAYLLDVSTSDVLPQSNYLGKGYGFSVRCVQN